MKKAVRKVVDIAQEGLLTGQFVYRTLKARFKSAVHDSPKARSLAFRFHYATMNAVEKRAYVEIKKTQGVYDNGMEKVPSFRIPQGMNAEVACKAAHVLELEQPQGALFAWECPDGVKAAIKNSERWF